MSDHDLWSDITNVRYQEKQLKLNGLDPLLHLEKNYQNIKSPIAFSGVKTFIIIMMEDYHRKILKIIWRG